MSGVRARSWHCANVGRPAVAEEVRAGRQARTTRSRTRVEAFVEARLPMTDGHLGIRSNVPSVGRMMRFSKENP